MEDQDRALPIHVLDFESHPSVECHSPPKNWVHPLSFMPHPIPLFIADHILEKSILTAFRQILPKSLPVVHNFSFITTTYLKKFIGIKSLITKQCPAELSPWIISPVSPILPKIFPLLSSCLLLPPCMDCPTHSPKLTVCGKPCRWGKNPAQQQISRTRKFPLNK